VEGAAEGGGEHVVGRREGPRRVGTDGQVWARCNLGGPEGTIRGGGGGGSERGWRARLPLASRPDQLLLTRPTLFSRMHCCSLVPFYLSHPAQACDDFRPCTRCVRLGLNESCVNAPSRRPKYPPTGSPSGSPPEDDMDVGAPVDDGEERLAQDGAYAYGVAPRAMSAAGVTARVRVDEPLNGRPAVVRDRDAADAMERLRTLSTPLDVGVSGARRLASTLDEQCAFPLWFWMCMYGCRRSRSCGHHVLNPIVLGLAA